MTEIRRLGGKTNAVVVQLPERQYPGVVIQQDSLLNLLALIRNAQKQMKKKNWEEATGVVGEIEELLAGYAGMFELR
jgi:hypothetical protein